MGANDYLDDGLAAQLVSLFRHSRVLDLGCGLGHYGHYLQSRVRRLARVCQAGSETHERALPRHDMLAVSAPSQCDPCRLCWPSCMG